MLYDTAKKELVEWGWPAVTQSLQNDADPNVRHFTNYKLALAPAGSVKTPDLGGVPASDLVRSKRR